MQINEFARYLRRHFAGWKLAVLRSGWMPRLDEVLAIFVPVLGWSFDMIDPMASHAWYELWVANKIWDEELKTRHIFLCTPLRARGLAQAQERLALLLSWLTADDRRKYKVELVPVRELTRDFGG